MTELYLYDSIDQGSAKAFIDQLNSHKGPLTIRINSGGGSVFEGLAIYNAIKRHGRDSGGDGPERAHDDS